MKPVRWRLIAAALGIFAAGVGLSIGLAVWHARQNHAIAVQQLELGGSALADSLRQRIASFNLGLHGLRGALTGRGDSAARYRDFASVVDLAREHPGALAFGYAQRIAPDKVGALLERIGRQYGRRVPLSTHNMNNGDRFVVVEAFGEVALGSDLAAMNLVREAGMRATWLDDAVLSPPVFNQPDEAPGFYLLYPVYRTGTAPVDSAQRFDAVAGWLFVYLSGNRLMSGIADQSLNYSLIDRDSEDNEYVIFVSEHRDATVSPGSLAGRGSDKLRLEFEQAFGGRTWRFSVTPAPLFWQRLGLLPAQLTFFVGTLIAALAALLSYVLLTMRQRALALAEAMTQALRVSESINRVTLDNASVGIMFTRDRKVLKCNPRFAEIFAWDSAEELVGKPGETFWPGAEDYAEVGRSAGPVLGAGKAFETERRMRRKDGSTFLAHIFAKAVDPLSTAGGTIWIAQDVTEQRRIEEAIKDSERKLAQMVNGNPVPTLVIDAEHRVTHWNQACAKLTGLGEAQMFGGTPLWQAFYPAPRPLLADLIVSEATDAVINGYYENFSHSKLIDGACEGEGFFPQMGAEGRWLHFTAAPLHDAAGKIVGAIETLQDITEERKAQAALHHLASMDGLTGVANRRRFNEILAIEWKRARREAMALSLLMLDVDHFKRYNDTYGHQAGDLCLQQVARVVGYAVRRPSDLVARYGGEEFAVIMPATDAEGAGNVAKCILERIAELAIPHSSGEGGQVTLSIGVATLFPAAELTQESLVAAADRALYQAKHAGRNRYCSARPEDDVAAG